MNDNSTNTDAAATKKLEEQSFSIQPHPARTNDPADLQSSQGLKQGGAMAAFAPGPVIPDEGMTQSLPKPLSREELSAKQVTLNQ